METNGDPAVRRESAPTATPAYPKSAPPIDGMGVEARSCEEAREAAEKAHLPMPTCYCGCHEQNPPCPS